MLAINHLATTVTYQRLWLLPKKVRRATSIQDPVRNVAVTKEIRLLLLPLQLSLVRRHHPLSLRISTATNAAGREVLLQAHIRAPLYECSQCIHLSKVAKLVRPIPPAVNLSAPNVDDENDPNLFLRQAQLHLSASPIIAVSPASRPTEYRWTSIFNHQRLSMSEHQHFRCPPIPQLERHWQNLKVQTDSSFNKCLNQNASQAEQVRFLACSDLYRDVTASQGALHQLRQ